MVAATVEEGAEKREEHLKGVVLSYFEHAMRVVANEKDVESVGPVGGEDVDGEADGGGL